MVLPNIETMCSLKRFLMSSASSLAPPSLGHRRCWDIRPPPASLRNCSSSHPESRAHTMPLARPLRDTQPEEGWEGWRLGGRPEKKRSQGINVWTRDIFIHSSDLTSYRLWGHSCEQNLYSGWGMRTDAKQETGKGENKIISRNGSSVRRQEGETDGVGSNLGPGGPGGPLWGGGTGGEVWDEPWELVKSFASKGNSACKGGPALAKALSWEWRGGEGVHCGQWGSWGMEGTVWIAQSLRGGESREAKGDWRVSRIQEGLGMRVGQKGEWLSSSQSWLSECQPSAECELSPRQIPTSGSSHSSIAISVKVIGSRTLTSAHHLQFSKPVTSVNSHSNSGRWALFCPILWVRKPKRRVVLCVGVSGKAVNVQVCAPGSRRISGKITASLCTCCAMLNKFFPPSVPHFLAFKMTSLFLKGLQLPLQRQLILPCSGGGEMIPGGD